MLDPNTMMRTLSVWALPLMLAITLHEFAHGWVASLRGDQSAKMLGRVTLNPFVHIDPIGTILVPLLLVLLGTPFLFGWAKPVPVNPNALKRPRQDMALVAFAGPLSNFIMACGWVLLAVMAYRYMVPETVLHDWLLAAAIAGVKINVILAILNLLPIPPLDGGRIVSSLIPPKWAYYYDQLEPYGFFILLGLLFTGLLGRILMPYYIGLMHFFATMIRHLSGL